MTETTEITAERLEQDGRLRRVLMLLTVRPRAWDQSSWVYSASTPIESPDDLELPGVELVSAERTQCGTTGCACGWGAIDAGAARIDERGRLVVDEAKLIALGVPLSDDDDLDPDDRLDWIELGAAVFGLEKHEAQRMFSGSNSLHDLWSYAASFTAGRVSLPAELVDRVTEIDWLRDSD